MKIKILVISLFFCGHILANGDTVHSELCYKGRCPTTRDERNYVADHHVFVLDVNCRTHFADWVAYIVDRNNLKGGGHSTHKRYWKTDPYVPKDCTTKPSDWYGAYGAYTYERGHMAPLSSFEKSPYWQKTNYLSNIEPQMADLNAGPWMELERHVRDLARMYGYVYVISGPIYRRPMDALPALDDAIVPSDYFKVIIIPNIEDNIQAYILPQDVPRHAGYYSYKSTVPEIEKLTGINLLGEK